MGQYDDQIAIEGMRFVTASPDDNKVIIWYLISGQPKKFYEIPDYDPDFITDVAWWKGIDVTKEAIAVSRESGQVSVWTQETP